jgi:hypothetical protein
LDATFDALFGVAEPDQVDQRLPQHCHLHVRERLIPLGPLLGHGVLVIREAELSAAYQAQPWFQPVITAFLSL